LFLPQWLQFFAAYEYAQYMMAVNQWFRAAVTNIFYKRKKAAFLKLKYHIICY
jgi:hypothetical protein